MGKLLEVEKGLLELQRHAMNIIGKRFYFQTRDDEDLPTCISSCTIRNVFCYHNPRGGEYPLSEIGLSSFTVEGNFKYDMLGKTVFLDEKNANLALCGKPFVVSEEIDYIRSEIEEIQRIMNVLKDEQMFFIMKERNIWQSCLMNIREVSIYTSGVPSGFNSNSKRILVKGVDLIGSLSQNYNEMCFTDTKLVMAKVCELSNKDRTL